MFVVISKFTIDNKDDMTDLVKRAFCERPGVVENSAGLVRMDIICPIENPNQIWLLTYWADQDNFQKWFHNHPYKEAHKNLPASLKLIGDQTEMLFFEQVSS